ncbi:MAG: NADH-quinone oxidoreductase subunit N [Hyphomicrobiales bacterium]
MIAWTLFAPELTLFGAALLFLALSLAKRPNPRAEFLAALAATALTIIVSLVSVKAEGVLFGQSYQVDLFSQVIKVLLALGIFLVVCICSNLNGVASRHHREFYLLLFTCTLAMMLLTSAVHLLSIYVALELSSYSLYVLVSLRRTREQAVAAALKYFIVGIVSSAVMLFGLALLYGTTGAVYLKELLRALPAAAGQPLVLIGLLLTLGGFFFKLAVFPFHIWAPDTYESSAHQVTAYLATASKIGAIAILVRMASVAGGSPYLVHVLVTLSILSMTVGNLASIVQKDLKRLFAYSSIAQAGYVLIGILSMSAEGFAASIFYTLALLVMKFTCFLVLVVVASDGANIDVAQLAGLHRRSPLLAMALMMAVFSLAGIPPTIGFTGKFLIFNAAIEKGLMPLVLIAMANVVISLYYYLLVVRAAYLLEPEADLPKLQLPPALRLLTGALVAVMVIAGVYPRLILEISSSAAAALVK